ncbi:hypothetical protein CK203_112981 [Vitis vinifera]|uniref:Uncharacterized protein n=1 Tax=Vitis vinifera TaxID=29760 RepID=A0A438C9L9_VITVI|nr:hypothetical protein CK203_112981 [Vitis vinifera]
MAPPAADMQQLKNTLKPSKNLCDIWLQVVLFFAVFGQPTSQSIVETLSAFSGTLPFKLETGARKNCELASEMKKTLS